MVLKPTKHYETLRQALNKYWHDNYETLAECYAHVLLDIMVWMGVKNFYAAVWRAGDLAIEQHDRATRELDEIGERFGVSQT